MADGATSAQLLDVQTDHTEGVVIAYVIGAVDASNVEEFRRAVDPLCAEHGAKVLLDLGGLTYLNSIGFGLLFAWNRTCVGNEGRFALCNMREKHHSILKLLGLEALLTVYRTRDEALSAMADAQR